ncbi:MAG TPA: hypothetical protein VLH36_13880 [Steroidobacteraceae bacterium]|nr:hypothetical protein [Steroidobacteraceae bacterium]
MNNVTPLWRRRRADLRPVQVAPKLDLPVVSHLKAAVRDDVPITTLVEALASHGLTFSSDPVHGLVIHPMPQGAA